MPPDSTTTPVLDAFDRAILAILQRDNTVAQREIAQAVHLSAPAVQRRIRRLRDSGVIRAEVAVLDASRLGRPLTLMVEVHVHDEHPLRTAGLHGMREGAEHRIGDALRGAEQLLAELEADRLQWNGKGAVCTVNTRH